MKIAVWHNLPSGGGKRALYNHVRGLVDRGHTVESWCPPTADQTYLPLSTLIPERVVAMQWPVSETLTDYWQMTLHVERRLAALEAHCRRCAAEMEAGGFEIIFANACQFFRTTPIARLSSIPGALYLGEPYRWLYEALPRLCWLAPERLTSPWWSLRTARAAFADLRRIRNWRVQAREELRDASAFRRILVNSYFSRESVSRAYGLDSSVCYLGIDLGVFSPVTGEREKFVVGLGSITPEKNIGLCIQAVARLAQPRPRLVWIANFSQKDYLAEMVELAADLNVGFDVRLRITDEELKDTLGRAAVMVYGPRLEPFGLAPLEANACGVPVVAVAEGGVRETVIDGVTGILVDNDPAAMSAAIDSLRTDPGFARRLGKSARDVAEQKWNLDAATTRLETELARVVNYST